MSKSRYTFEYLHSGQRRPYGDSFVEGILTVEFLSSIGDEWRVMDVGEGQAKSAARGFVYWEDEPSDPFTPTLDLWEKVEPGKWKVITRRRYDD